ncbi:MAG: hypothetical protein HQ570_03850 [Candidatus Omnitrophica bacterium]|nr:hypothetical protein [Candidatus Omnitrophota bacterium]
MIRKIFISILVSLGFLSFAYSQSKYKDPFESLLPQKVEIKIRGEEEGQEKMISDTEESIPFVVVQGILWRSDFPQVIIGGEVYRVGDKLKDIDAQVLKIENGEVFISYGEKIYKMRIKKEEEI